MASVGHLLVAAAGATFAGRRRFGRTFLLLSALSFLPDADVIAFEFGVRYAAPFGHRGATHSLPFALIAGLGGAFARRAWGVRLRAALPICLTVAASHTILDAMTDGGLGVALFWPFEATRYFLPCSSDLSPTSPRASTGASMARARRTPPPNRGPPRASA